MLESLSQPGDLHGSSVCSSGREQFGANRRKSCPQYMLGMVFLSRLEGLGAK